MFTLTILGGISLFVTLGAFGGLLAYRLVFVHLTSSAGVKQGALDWLAETRARLGLPVRPPPAPAFAPGYTQDLSAKLGKAEYL
jgi:hypothetical protein